MKNLVEQLREERELSKTALAEKLDVSRQTIHAIEVGKYDPSLKLAFKIARLFEKSIEDIFLYDEE
ncbi:MAG: helix-turn-helix transcriptional regulator [Candidatus Heimdallarchaeota archaeon]|nr:helix-turn-helix transcriptional regulator [Candidatus Heimdallarchaeota archaeon]